MAKALGKYETEGYHFGYIRTVEKAMCSNCGAYIIRSQYGCDDECPGCGEFVDWFAEDEKGE